MKFNSSGHKVWQTQRGTEGILFVFWVGTKQNEAILSNTNWIGLKGFCPQRKMCFLHMFSAVNQPSPCGSSLNQQDAPATIMLWHWRWIRRRMWFWPATQATSNYKTDMSNPKKWPNMGTSIFILVHAFLTSGVVCFFHRVFCQKKDHHPKHWTRQVAPWMAMSIRAWTTSSWWSWTPTERGSGPINEALAMTTQNEASRGVWITKRFNNNWVEKQFHGLGWWNYQLLYLFCCLGWKLWFSKG